MPDSIAARRIQRGWPQGTMKRGRSLPFPGSRVLALLLLSLQFFLLRDICADGGGVPDINQCGVIETNRPLPAYALDHRHLSSRAVAPEGGHYDCTVSLALKGYGELLLLQTYAGFQEEGADWDPKERVNWDYVAGRNVALGWLAGATNLMLVSWQDTSASHGTGHYVGQHYVVASVVPGHSRVLLRTSVLAEGSTRHVNSGCGLGQHHFQFDAANRILTDRASFYRQLCVGYCDNIPPLHYRATEGDAETTDMFLAQISETVVFKYRYNRDQLKRASVELFYKTQPRDTVRDIARFYLGPLAIPSAILQANPTLQAKVTGKHEYEIGITRFPPGTLVKIPVPEDGIIRFYR